MNLYSLNVLFTIMPAAGRRVSSVNHLTVSDQNVLIYSEFSYLGISVVKRCPKAFQLDWPRTNKWSVGWSVSVLWGSPSLWQCKMHTKVAVVAVSGRVGKTSSGTDRLLLLYGFWKANTGASVADCRPARMPMPSAVRWLLCVGGSLSGPFRSASSWVHSDGRQATRLTRLQSPDCAPLISY